MSTKREINESPVYQGADEVIAYSIDFDKWGTPTSPVVTMLEKPSMTDVSDDTLTGYASVTGDIVTTPAVADLAAGTAYIMLCQVAIDGNTLSAWCDIICDPV